jgi:hypothetical protein
MDAYRATVLYACLMDGQFYGDTVRRGRLLDDTIQQMSKVVQQNHAVQFLTPGLSLLETLAHCHALRDALASDRSTSTMIQHVTSDLRQAIRRLIEEGSYAEAITLAQNVYGIGNSAVLHRFDADTSG